MNIIDQIKHDFCRFLSNTFNVSLPEAQHCSLELNVDESKQQFGDLTSNAAMVLAKKLKKNPREIAQQISDQFKHEMIESIEVAGPGFLNITLAPDAFSQLAQKLLAKKTSFFQPLEQHTQNYNIEFVSANPTGPLHFGHGRGGIIGDVLANVLRFLGHYVTKEFYINDAGAQMKKLGISLKIRCEQAAGMKTELPEDAYHGKYLIELAEELHKNHDGRLLDQPLSFFESYAQTKMLEMIKKTLEDYGILFDVWFSEKTLHESGSIEEAIALLKKSRLVYEQDGALWFKSTQFGDDKDRVLKKKTGEFTYAAPDIAYMQDKVNRGVNNLVYILGHDHHSYATRLQGMKAALGFDRYPLNVILYQLVKLKEGEQQIKMSKRKGTIVTLRDVIEAVGKDVARFFYLQRKADAQLEFDLELALKHTDENPVYYIQYAYVRTGSILHNAEKEKELQNITVDDLKHLTPADQFLLKKIVSLNSVLHTIQETHQTHLLAYYTHELAQAFNRYYNKNRVIDVKNIPLSRARLGMVIIMRETLGLCLGLLGLSKPTKM